MTDDLDYVKHMMAADRDHAWGRACGAILEPVGGKPQIADGLAEHLESHATTAERHARTTFGMIDDPRIVLYARHANSFHARVASDNRAYLVASIALALGLVAMLLGLLYFVAGDRPAPSKIAVNDAWCSGFAGLNCKTQGNARKD